jgi:hypothetical protein
VTSQSAALLVRKAAIVSVAMAALCAAVSCVLDFKTERTKREYETYFATVVRPALKKVQDAAAQPNVGLFLKPFPVPRIRVDDLGRLAEARDRAAYHQNLAEDLCFYLMILAILLYVWFLAAQRSLGQTVIPEMAGTQRAARTSIWLGRLALFLAIASYLAPDLMDLSPDNRANRRQVRNVLFVASLGALGLRYIYGIVAVRRLRRAQGQILAQAEEILQQVRSPRDRPRLGQPPRRP